MKRKHFSEQPQENPFALSIGDLMAALLLIFVLLLTSTLLRLQDEFENKSKVAERYTEVKENLYKKLSVEFKDSLKNWKAEIDSLDLTVRFKEPSMFFALNSSAVKPEFKSILNYFFPKYIEVLYGKDFRNNIEEIRIEGHTDTIGGYFEICHF